MPALATSDLDRAQRGLHLGERGLDLAGSVTSHCHAEHAVRDVAAAVGGRHPVSGIAQPGGDPAADPLAAAGHQHHPGHSGTHE